MSSRSISSRKVSLSLTAPPGIAIRLLDGELREVASGYDLLVTRCEPGLYMVEWTFAGRQSETMVRVDGSRDPLSVEFPAKPEDAQITIDPTLKAHVVAAAEIEGALARAPGRRGSSVVLVVAKPNPGTDLEKLDLQLMSSDRSVESDDHARVYLKLATNQTVRSYKVRPGRRHHVTFRAVTGELLAMSLPVLPGRRTLVFLTATEAEVLVADEGQLDRVQGVGVDPSRTVVLTTSGEEEEGRVGERVRVATQLLYDLANGSTSLSPDLAREIDDDRADPMLKLYAASVALSRLERGMSPDPTTPPDRRLARAERSRWLQEIERWLPPAGRTTEFTSDAAAARWEARRAGAETQGDRSRAPSHIEAPPMLGCSWRWAIEESVDRPSAVRGTAQLAAAGRSSSGTAPWLCWKVSSAKARPQATDGKAADLPTLIRTVADAAEELAKRSDWTDNLVELLATASPETQATALEALHWASGQAGNLDEGAVTELALALGLPASQLRRRLTRASSELAAADPTQPTPAARSRTQDVDPSRAPGLARRITRPDDPQKGRFGGEARIGNFELSACFGEKDPKTWATITLCVKGPAPDGEEVQFHLHDSFKPPLEREKFKRGRAKLEVTAYGGFTVGAWLPSRQIELELDLARLENAPRIVRER